MAELFLKGIKIVSILYTDWLLFLLLLNITNSFTQKTELNIHNMYSILTLVFLSTYIENFVIFLVETATKSLLKAK